jgi:hypothetical protein
MTNATATHVTNICHTAHTATGVFIQDATDNSEPRTIPDLRPRVQHYRKASTGELLFQRVSGIGRTTQWLDAKGDPLFAPDLGWEEPEVEPISKYADWLID